MSTRASELPRWDMTTVFGPEPDAVARAYANALAGIDELVALFDRFGIHGGSAPAMDGATVAAAEEVIAAWNRVSEAVASQQAYWYCLISADTGDQAAQATFNELQQQSVPLAALQARLTAWVGSLDLDALFAASAPARGHAFALRDLHTRARHLMSPPEEALAAELAPAGAAAWFRLREDIDGALTAPIEIDGETKRLPVTEIDEFFSRPDRDLRARAHAAIEGARAAVAVPLAAALNGVKGEQLTLLHRRRWDDPLDAALAANHLDRETLDAMLAAIRAAVPTIRRFFTAKARALGVPTLANYDLNAPVSDAGDAWPYDEAERFVTAQFATFSPKLAAFAERATAARWIDAGPREGKVGGGFCYGVGEGRTRILLNYTPSFLWLSGLAHELGHAYHDAVAHERGRTWLQVSHTPPALAETASTFCETLVQRRAIVAAPAADRFELLNGALQTQMITVFLTTMMFDVERAIFAARASRPLSAEELTEIGRRAQQELFGDALEPEHRWRSQWSAIPHFFLPDLWYYNFPYAFGMLFAIGLYARYEADPEPFVPAFDDLLADTGTANAVELAARFGIDLHSRDFWDAGLSVIADTVAAFERTAHARPAQ